MTSFELCSLRRRVAMARITTPLFLCSFLIVLCPLNIAFDYNHQPLARFWPLPCNQSDLALKSIKADLNSTKVKECCPNNQCLSQMDCPENCRYFSSGNTIQASDVKIDEESGNVTLLIEDLKTTYVHDYCAAYKCSLTSQPFQWKVGFSLCICATKEDLVKDIVVDGKKLPSCCPTTFFLREKTNKKEIECPFDDHFKVQSDDIREFNHNETHGKIDWVSKGEEERHQDSLICYGRSWAFSARDYFSHLVKTWAVIKRQPCNGISPCLRYCDSKAKDKVKDLFDKYKVDQAPPSERNNCSSTNMKRTQEEICISSIQVQNEKFILNNGIVEFQENEFCLTFHDDILKAEHCKEELQDAFKFKVYPAFWILSSICLALTLLAFIFIKDLTYTKTRTSIEPEQINYNLLTRQYVLSLLIGMIGLTANQLHSFNGIFCTFFAYYHLFFFLSSFSIMSQMSLELVSMCTWYNQKRYIAQLCTGYGIPALICILACIVDTFAQNCSGWFKPGLGEENCFLKKGLSAIGLWFYLPIGISLIFNAVCFAKFLKSSTLSNEDLERLGQVAVDRQRERKLTFAKIFVASGFTWSFEIISGLIGGNEFLWYLPDIFNMLQGVYIFVIFICKRSVLKKIQEFVYTKMRRNQNQQLNQRKRHTTTMTTVL